PRDRPYVEQEIPRFFLHSTEFIKALEWMLIGKLYGSVPRSQHHMTREARQSWEKARAELAALRGGNDEDFVDLQDPIAEREYHWDRFCHLSASIDAGYTLFEHPGTMA